jgi:hypothetical protein
MATAFKRMLEAEMSRKQFLVNVGTALIALVGISTILKSFGLQEGQSGTPTSSSYGGHQDDSQFRKLP